MHHTPPSVPKLAMYRRVLLQDQQLLVVSGDISNVIQGMKTYNDRYGIANPDADIVPQLQRLLAAVSLAAVLLSERESWGWSLTLPGAPFGYFVGAEPEGMLCARIKPSDPDRSVAIVQRQKKKFPLCESVFHPQDGDPVHAVALYFKKVDQLHARLAVDPQGWGCLVHALPGGDPEAIADLDDADIFAFGKRHLEKQLASNVGEVVLFYDCRCHQSAVLGMVEKLSQAGQQELWGGQDTADVTCPRCGREFRIMRGTAS
ncbi:MAG: Hsp33 family molecular chaperone HslO [Myxococcota bacterium]|nr:Hsp33 family molecular chaperone HslO [Myxococcota bacterium]